MGSIILRYIADENQTVKAVNEAKAKLSQVENDIRHLESAKSNVASQSYGWGYRI